MCLVPQQCILISIQGSRTWENYCLPADIVIDCYFFHCWNGSICKSHVTVIIKYYTGRNATIWNISGPLLILSESIRMDHVIKGLSCAISVTGGQDLVMLSHTPGQSPVHERPLMIQVELLPILEIPPFKRIPKVTLWDWCVCVSCESSANLLGPRKGNECDVRSVLLIFIGTVHSEGVSHQNTSETNFAPVCHGYNYWFFSKVSISFPLLLIWGALLWSYCPQGLGHIMLNTFHHSSHRKCFLIVFVSVVFS